MYLVFSALVGAAAIALLWWLWQWISARPFNIRGGVAVITGAGGGLGRSLAVASVQRGLKVALWDSHGARLEETAAEVAKHGGDSVIIDQRVLDVTSPAAVNEAVNDVAAVSNGGPLLLFNNAGIVLGKEVAEQEDAHVERVFQVNVLAHFRLVRLFLPVIEERGGCVIAISSLMALAGGAKATAYVSSKWAVNGFMESLRMELAANNSAVRTLIVCPYVIATEMFAGTLEEGTWAHKIAARLQPTDVTTSIFAAIESGRAMIVVPPAFGWSSYATRLLPLPVHDFVIGALGGWYGMQTFRGQGLQRAGNGVTVTSEKAKSRGRSSSRSRRTRGHN